MGHLLSCRGCLTPLRRGNRRPQSAAPAGAAHVNLRHPEFCTERAKKKQEKLSLITRLELFNDDFYTKSLKGSEDIYVDLIHELSLQSGFSHIKSFLTTCPLLVCGLTSHAQTNSSNAPAVTSEERHQRCSHEREPQGCCICPQMKKTLFPFCKYSWQAT